MSNPDENSVFNVSLCLIRVMFGSARGRVFQQLNEWRGRHERALQAQQRGRSAEQSMLKFGKEVTMAVLARRLKHLARMAVRGPEPIFSFIPETIERLVEVRRAQSKLCNQRTARRTKEPDIRYQVTVVNESAEISGYRRIFATQR